MRTSNQKRTVMNEMVSELAERAWALLLVGIISYGVVGCSSTTGHLDNAETATAPQSTSTEGAAVSYSLYLNRSSLTAQEFEQYKALPQGLFMECGTVYRGRADVREQGIQSVSPEKRQTLHTYALEIFETLRSQEAPHFDAPGTGAGFADPGKFTLVVTRGSDTIEVKTSLDWVEQKQTVLAKKLHTFTRELRGSAERAPCNNDEFYGLTRVL